jgi:hypothetical protein
MVKKDLVEQAGGTQTFMSLETRRRRKRRRLELGIAP